MCSWEHFWSLLGPGGPLGSQMVDLWCQDTDWVGGNDKDFSNAILLQDGLTLATFGMDKGKHGNLG